MQKAKDLGKKMALPRDKSFNRIKIRYDRCSNSQKNNLKLIGLKSERLKYKSKVCIGTVGGNYKKQTRQKYGEVG